LPSNAPMTRIAMTSLRFEQSSHTERQPPLRTLAPAGGRGSAAIEPLRISSCICVCYREEFREQWPPPQLRREPRLAQGPRS
jgi:hypothetical protein